MDIFGVFYFIILIIISGIVWVQSARDIAKGKSSYTVEEDAILGYIIAMTWPLVLMLIIFVLPFLLIGHLSKYCKNKLIKHIQERNESN